MSTLPTITVEVYSDIACPWCFIGDKSLTKAADSPSVKEKANVVFKFHPYVLHPSIPAEGIPRAHSEIFGKRIKTAAAEVGIEFSGNSVTSNTIDANRLIFKTAELGTPQQQHKLVSLLFERYFEQGQNVGDHKVLIEVAKEVGLDAAAIEKYLQTEQDRKEVVSRTAAARQKGVTGVPHYVFNGGYQLTGGQSVHTFEHLLKTLAKKASPESKL